MSGQVPDGIQVFRYEGGDLSYEPRDSAPADWNGDLGDLSGDYISVKSIEAIRSDERSKVEGELRDGLEDRMPDWLLTEIRATERSKVVGQVREALKEQADEYRREGNEAKDRSEFTGAAKMYTAADIVDCVTEIVIDGLNQEAPDE